MSEHKFSALKLAPEILANLESLGYPSMTAIQAQSLPHILAGKDVIVHGQTGSGKTAAFGLGLISRLETTSFNVQSLVLCPTRELADQVSSEIRRLARNTPNIKVVTLCGGAGLRAQQKSLEHGAHIVVGTPGRIADHLEKNTLNLSHINTLVLDEADRMLDMGFQATLDGILESLPTQRQTLLLSATYPEQIKSIAGELMQSPIMCSVAASQDTVRVDESIYQVESEPHRLTALRLLLLDQQAQAIVVFCNTRKDTQSVAGQLKSAGFSAVALHGELEQKDREQTLIRFSNKSINVLVATDVAARGLDIESIDLVVNYQLPRELDVYTHRIGRTARAGAAGAACSLFTMEEQFRIDKLQSHLSRELSRRELPDQRLLDQPPRRPLMSTLRVAGGKKQKLRAGDIVGALTAGGDIDAQQIGKIQISDSWSYIAVQRKVAKSALQKLSEGKLKGKRFRARLI